MSTEESNEKKGFSEKNSQLIALTALIFTIFATFASLYAGGNANNAIMSENMANNCWVYYQSKSMKEDMCHIQLEFLKHSSTENEDPEKVERLMNIYQEHIDRYLTEQKSIEEKAQEFERERDHFRSLNVGFKFSLVYLQIAIMLVSLAGLLKKKYFWYTSFVPGLVGIYRFIATMMMS